MLRTALSKRVCAWLTATAILGISGLAFAGTEDADRLLTTGITAYRTGAPAPALQSFAEAAAKAPNDALPALWAGVAAAAVGRWQDSREYLREALRRSHTPEEARVAEAWLARLEAFDTPTLGEIDPATTIARLAFASNPRLTLREARWLGDAVHAAAGRAGIDSWLLASVIYIESRFNHESVSWAGARDGAGRRGRPEGPLAERPGRRAPSPVALPGIQRLDPRARRVQRRGAGGATLRRSPSVRGDPVVCARRAVGLRPTEAPELARRPVGRQVHDRFLPPSA